MIKVFKNNFRRSEYAILICCFHGSKLIYYHRYLYYKFFENKEDKKIFEEVFRKRNQLKIK